VKQRETGAMLEPAVLTVEPLNTTIGAVVRCVDLSGAMPTSIVAGIRDALLRHKVVFFENQQLDSLQLRDVAARFGELHTHPLYPGDERAPEIMLLDNGPHNPTDNDMWHTDVTFLERPAMAALLYAEIVPATGGDTLWSNMTAAYAALSPPMQAFLAGLSAVHDFVHAFPAEGLAGRAILHEYDHLEGKLFIDYLSPLTRQLLKGRLKKMAATCSL